MYLILARLNSHYSQIKNENIEIINCFKFLGTIISNDLKYNSKTTILLKKAHQRIYFLRQQNKFN